ncbi:type II toxin-antitoxin system death-on-curing family toxin [Fulvivirga lutea]|uniref:Type II toxin-antitoxin system death-on-curing family toxin n=1 Tax=Fulvivirga lutea TaxID=2810512 RepID=A0A974WJM9_9BACT|nr:type II toxin-antitoxin system death-on-curing family toxin [Fulvivirga lutea]QSE99008.1 type II toxin-antitoxin system death-on-curing family toxin [Fulvivirga lutea]
MLEIKDVLSIHERLIQEFGGASGLKDKPLLESAISRPFQTFDGKDLYQTPEEKASALLESILINHPFVDGNKRTGYTLFRLILLSSNMDIDATEDDKYDMVISVAEGKTDYAKILEWTRKRIKPVW